MSSEEIRRARVALACLVEPGAVEVYQLVAQYGPVGAVEALVAGQVPERLAAAVQARLAGTEVARLAERALIRTDRLGARVVIPGDDEWPNQLADLHRISRPGTMRVDQDTYPPVCLWVRGAPPLGPTLDRSVAVVGARASTSYGNHIAVELAFGLANRDWAVVSGGAYGIDAAAHRGALWAGSPWRYPVRSPRRCRWGATRRSGSVRPGWSPRTRRCSRRSGGSAWTWLRYHAGRRRTATGSGRSCRGSWTPYRSVVPSMPGRSRRGPVSR